MIVFFVVCEEACLGAIGYVFNLNIANLVSIEIVDVYNVADRYACLFFCCRFKSILQKYDFRRPVATCDPFGVLDCGSAVWWIDADAYAIGNACIGALVECGLRVERILALFNLFLAFLQC